MTQRDEAAALAAGRDALHTARLERTRDCMRRAGVPALVVLDPVNIGYATGARNMTIFAMRTPARYLLLFAEGPAVLFDYFGCEHLARGLPTIDEIRPAKGLCFVSSGGEPASASIAFADEIAALVRAETGSIGELAIDRFPYRVVEALKAQGFTLRDADEVFCPARAIKMPIELPYMWEAMRRVEAAATDMEAAIRPGRSENEIWAEFHRPFIAREGQYIVTRLLQSGPQTFPYFQECNSRIVERGDLVCFDSDTCGYEGYCVDFSRSYLVGDGTANDDQLKLFGLAREQLEWNVELIKPGASYREIAEKAWPVPEAHQDSRYYCIGHGLGVAGEFPNIPHATPGAPYPLDGGIAPGMVICVESYIGSAHVGQGVKLEQQLLVTETGTELMSRIGFDARLETNTL